ncbi:redoxin domain-containing protein [Alterisphingorhabdus coralli]|uniref:Redoxin domain-containing protein n=1 Tax=Alterisphingorhabdus coralli TaxID=3071408 RepID=A0AA97F5N3_9SPHN|nr:redoxin domain-containing protein [Parasphingorhabdus sp. SCSIO 66989]WOE74666.1 redoxin domain-containing protein [Parasphingorhabdus sp. SCSIO 66989]
MTTHTTLLPGQPSPDLMLDRVGGGHWSLRESTAERMVLIDFYRGLHCPRCKLHVIDIKNKLARFADRGVACVAISMDERQRAESAVSQWGLEGLDVGYGLSEEQARSWGLYLTDSINEREPRRFSEPAIIMVDSRNWQIYSAVYGTNPFNRVHAADILEGFDAMLARDYPPRGSVV